MKLRVFFFLFTISIYSCQNKNKQSDISHTKIPEIKNTTKIPNKIDSLETESEVRDFMANLKAVYSKKEEIVFGFNTTYNLYHKEICKSIYDSTNTKSFFKGDFDQNGYTDIGIMYYELQHRYELNGGQIFLIILGKPNNEFEVRRPYSTWFFKQNTSCSTFELGHIEKLSFSGLTFKKEQIPVIFHDYEPLDIHEKKTADTKRQHDTLIFWKNNFVEYNSRPSKYKIHNINIDFLGSSNDDICCNPHFDIKYTKDSIFYEGRMWIKEGAERAENNIKEYEELCEILNYVVDFSESEQDLRQHKKVEINYIIEIIYDDNKKLRIIDGHSCYCLFSSFGMDMFYDTILQTKFLKEKRMSIFSPT